MGNNRSRVAPAQHLRIIDNQARARYKNQRELIQLRRKLANINSKHNHELARLAVIQHDAKITLYELQHENSQRQLVKKLDQMNQQNTSVSSSNASELFDESTIECSSLLLHNLYASNEWEKSIIIQNMPSDQSDVSDKTKPNNNVDAFRLEYSSKFDTSRNSFEQSESFLLSNSSPLKQQTKRMKKSTRISVAKSTRGSNTIARRNAHKH